MEIHSKQRNAWGAIVLLLLSARCVAASAAASEDEVARVLKETEARQRQAMKKQFADPFPARGPKRHEDFALAAYWLNKRTAEADEALLTVQKEYPDKFQKAFHWQAYILARMYFLFSSRSDHFPGRMGQEAEEAILDMLWQWASSECERKQARPENVWQYWESENHHLQRWVSCWSAAHIFKNHPDYRDHTYGDGSSPAKVADTLDEYFKRFAAERATKGLLVETASPSYAKYSLNAWYNLVDFADDPELKRLARMFLDVYWADWAIEQINGVRGGSRHRCYPGSRSTRGSGASQLCWYHFGLGDGPNLHPGAMCAATTFYRPAPVVVELALGWPRRGEYTYASRRPGLKAEGAEGNQIDPAGGNLLRVSWCTPDFVLGMSEVACRDHQDWTGICSQNRWNGLIFGGHRTARLFTQRPKPGRWSVYNAEWGVQSKGVMILQLLPPGMAKDAKGQSVWFDKSLHLHEKGGWVFARGPRAFAAVRIVTGGSHWEPDTKAQHRGSHRRPAKRYPTGLGKWLVLEDKFSPVIIEAARQKDYPTMAAFEAAILANPLTLKEERLAYRSEFYDTTLTLFTDYSRLPEVDGKPLDLAPKKVYDSPYLQADFGGDVVTIRSGDNVLRLDFSPPEAAPAGR